jgi:hypothetical protein
VSPFDASFKLWWGQNYATKSLFGHSEELGQIIFSEIWTLAVQESAAVTEDISPAAAQKVRTLCT